MLRTAATRASRVAGLGLVRRQGQSAHARLQRRAHVLGPGAAPWWGAPARRPAGFSTSCLDGVAGRHLRMVSPVSPTATARATARLATQIRALRALSQRAGSKPGAGKAATEVGPRRSGLQAAREAVGASPKESILRRLTHTVSVYGPIAVVWGACISGVTLTMSYALVESGLLGPHAVQDVMYLLKLDAFFNPEAVDPTVGSLGLAILINELLNPIRWAILLATLPRVSRWFYGLRMVRHSKWWMSRKP